MPEGATGSSRKTTISILYCDMLCSDSTLLLKFQDILAVQENGTHFLYKKKIKKKNAS